MRILWISSILIVTIILVAVFTHSPPEQVVQPALPSEEPLQDPFATEQAVNKDVTLAKLPAGGVNKKAQKNNEREEVEEVEVVEVEAVIVAGASGSSIAEDLAEVQQELRQEQQEKIAAAEKIEKVKAEVSPEQPITVKKSITVTQVSFSSEAAQPQEDLRELRRKYLAGNKKSDHVAIIVHEKNKENVTAKDIKNMYLERLTHWRNGARISLFNLPLGDKSRERFSRKILNMSALKADQLESQRRDENDPGNPATVKAKNIIVSYVERDPNAIAYVPISAIRTSSQVKVLFTIPE